MATKLILLKSAEGESLLNDCRAGKGLYQEHLHSIFKKQVGDSSCGIVTSAQLMSAPFVAKGNMKDGVGLPYTEDNMFYFQQTLSVITKDKINDEVHGGMTLSEVTKLLTAHGCQVKMVHASDDTAKGVIEFCEDVKTVLSNSDSKSGLAVNYHMDVLGQGCPYGHFSPLGAYHPGTDRVLILDTWKDTHECWARVEDLYEAMNTVDDESKLKRGYIVVSP